MSRDYINYSIPISPFGVFPWHYFIRSSVTVTVLGNRIGRTQLLLRLLLLSLPIARRISSSSTKGRSESNLLFCLSFVTFLLLAEPSEFSSVVKAQFCAILIIIITSNLNLNTQKLLWHSNLLVQLCFCFFGQVCVKRQPQFQHSSHLVPA